MTEMTEITPMMIAEAARLVSERPGKVWLVKRYGRTPWPTSQTPAGQSVGVVVGEYTTAISLDTLRADLADAHSRLAVELVATNRIAGLRAGRGVVCEWTTRPRSRLRGNNG